MAKTYRAAQQWDHWFTQFLGHQVLEAEQNFLLQLLANYFGKHALLIGVPRQDGLLRTTVTARQTLLSPLLNKNHHIKSIESEFYELPIASGSVDLVMLPHTLEYLDNPRQLLSEACRIVKPEGHIIILGFNLFSLWGLKKSLAQKKSTPWSNNFIQAGTVKKWLQLADFELVKQNTFLFRPPLKRHGLYKKLHFLEWLGRKIHWPFGGAYGLVAKAKVIPLTPIRLSWQQQLSGVQIRTIPGPSMRDF